MRGDDQTDRSRLWGTLAAVLLLVLFGGLVACAPEPVSNGEGAGEAEVVMENTSYQPGEIVVSPGTTVTWVNEDGFAHTVTAGSRDNPTGAFDETVSAGASFSYTFEEPGTYAYFCSIHPGMSGTVVVEE